MGQTFQQRLARCVRRGDLTVADLCRWFDRPYATVRSWLVEGWEPGGGPRTRDRMETRLAKLEQVVARHENALTRLTMSERAELLQELGGSQR